MNVHEVLHLAGPSPDPDHTRDQRGVKGRSPLSWTRDAKPDSTSHLSGQPSRRILTGAVHPHNAPRSAAPAGLPGLPIAERCDESERKCGVYAVDLESGQVAGFLVFEAGCAELFDIQVLPGMRWPAIVGFQD